MSDLPVACTLTESELGARRTALLPGLAGRAESVEPLPDGYRFLFAATSDNLAAIATAVDAERRCCRFLRFELVVEPGLGPVSLRVTGPAGTREFLEGVLDKLDPGF